MTEPITKDVVEKMNAAYKAYEEYEKQITNRVDYVIKTIAKIFGTKLEWYDWSNGGGETDGHFEPRLISGNSFQLDGAMKKRGEMVAITKDGEWEFTWMEIPTRFLYENFEQELEDGIKKFKEQEEARKIKEKEIRIQKEIDRQKLLEAAKQKLSKEERKALGIR